MKPQEPSKAMVDENQMARHTEATVTAPHHREGLRELHSFLVVSILQS